MDFNACESQRKLQKLLSIDLLIIKDLILYEIYPFFNSTPNVIGIQMQLDSHFERHPATQKEWWNVVSKRRLPDGAVEYIHRIDNSKIRYTSKRGNNSCHNDYNIEKCGWSRKGWISPLTEDQRRAHLNYFCQKHHIYANLYELEDMFKVIQEVKLYKGDECILQTNPYPQFYDQLEKENENFYLLYEDQLNDLFLQLSIKIRYNNNHFDTIFQSDMIPILPIKNIIQ